MDNSWYEKFEKHFKAAIEKSIALGTDLVVGKIFSIGVADGYAYYEVVRVNKKTVRIKWRKDLCLDEYCYYGWGGGGTFDKELIEHKVVCQDSLAMLIQEIETPNDNKD